MEIIALTVLCGIVIAGSGAAVYRYEKAIRLLKDELLVCYADIKGLRNSVDNLRRTSDHYECEWKLATQKCAELRDTLLRQSRDRAFAIRHKAAHPGELLKELYFKNTTIMAIAKQSGVAKSVIQRILVGKQAVTADAAYKFEKAYGVSALLLLQMQANHDLHVITCNK